MLLHGWGMNSHVWEPIKEALESRYHLVCLDLPGHGFNKHLDAKNLDHIVDLVADVTPEDTHIVGWSLGGLVAQALAQKIPNKIRSLTLVASTPRFSQSLQNDWTNAMSHEVLNKFADNLKHDPVKTIKGFIALQFIGVKESKQVQDDLISHILNDGKSAQPSDSETTKECSDADSKGEMQSSKKWGGVFLSDSEQDSASNSEQSNNIPTREALEAGLRILQNADLRSLKSTCPEHWIFAEHDRLIPKEVINDLKSLRPDAQITLLEKAGHAPFITHTEIFMKQLSDFIDTQP